MCGITGKIYFDSHHKVDFSELKSMTDSFIHRGPDDEGHYLNGNVGLGFRRLSIIDIKSGHQPLCDNHERYWITFNGEIYNFQELREDLKKKGYYFRTNSDTEVIVNLYAEYKQECLGYLRGMFAFVIWDNRKKVLFGARDRFGIKPFHYYMDNEKFVWGSELKSIMASNGIEKEISLPALDYYFAYGYSQRDKTIFSQIQKLKPAEYFIFRPFEDNKLEIKPYWSIDFTPDYSKNASFWKDAIYEALNESVKMRMISDVPLGAFLSGGIDSSIVVSLMAINSEESIKTFSIGFKEEKYNELKYARIIAEKHNTEHHEFIVEPESIGLLPGLVTAYDEPFADISAIPTYYVSKLTREHVTVALSGDGGDEFFAGYPDYLRMLAMKKAVYNNKLTNKFLFGPVNRLMPDYLYGKGHSYLLSKDKKNIGAYICMWRDYERRKLFLHDVRKSIGRNDAEKNKLELIRNHHLDFISRMQKLDIQTFMVDDILTKVDRASMINSLEVRVPFLDHKLAELSFKIPWEFKLKDKNMKYILKESFKPILPAEILLHKKQGFAVPMKMWFKDSLKEYAYDTLLQNSKLDIYLDINYVRTILDNHQKGLRNYHTKIWSLLFLNEWLNQNA